MYIKQVTWKIKPSFNGTFTQSAIYVQKLLKLDNYC